MKKAKSTKNKIKKLFIQKQEGLSLVGVMIAMVIIALSLTAGLTFMQNANRLSSVSRNKIIASFLATEGVELMKNIESGVSSGGGNGFQALEKLIEIQGANQASYSIDYKTPVRKTINLNENNVGIIFTGHKFDETGQGLCLDLSNTFTLCSINTSKNKKNFFIRKITLKNNDPADCKDGITITSTVYWKETWENDSVSVDQNDLDNLHSSYDKACIYEWR